VKRNTQQSDVIGLIASHVKSNGKNFKPLIAAGSWQISGFHYGKSKCACCGRPIRHVLELKNESHADAAKRDAAYPFTETIDIGIVCGPKVFTESCIGFYDDPEREWERQLRSWKDYINYVVLCVKNEDLWKRVPEGLRTIVDQFLAEGYKTQDHSGGWWMVKDAKKRFLKVKRAPDMMPEAYVAYSASRNLQHACRKQSLIGASTEIMIDQNTGEMSLRDNVDRTLPRIPRYGVMLA